MARKNDQVAKRLAAISSAKPVEINAPKFSKAPRPKRAQREETFRPGKIYTSSTNFHNCVIMNVSDTGALVRMESEYGIPDIVVLRIIQTGVTKKARVIWRDETDIGLHFVEDLTRRPSRPAQVSPSRSPNEGGE